MKAVLSNKLYFKPTEELLKRIETGLTYQIFEPHKKQRIPKLIRHYGPVARGTYWIPASRIDLLQDVEDLNIIDKRIDWPEDFPEPKFSLREDQQEIFDDVTDSCIINAKPGFGKTILAQAIAAKLKQKTLVVTTNTVIRDMWIKDVRKWFDIEPGIIGSGKFDHNSPITIANIQTLAKHGLRIADQFGLVIVDECFDCNTCVTLADGTKQKIGDIVNNKETPLVRSYNIDTKKWESRRVVRHFKHKQDMFLELSSKQGSIKCTNNHNMYVLEGGNIQKRQAKDCAVGTELIADKGTCIVKDWGLMVALLLGGCSLSRTNEGIRLQVPDECTWMHGLSNLAPEEDVLDGTRMYRSYTFKDAIGLYDMIYSDRDKAGVMQYADWRAWAYLIMHRGSYSKGTIDIPLYRADRDLIMQLASKFFSDKDFEVHTCSKECIHLRLKNNAVLELVKNITHEVHPDLYHKLGLDNTYHQYNPSVEDLFENFNIFTIENIKQVPASDGYRYNIEVEGNHNYVANDTLVSNCHHTPADTFSKVLFESKARYKIGLSGTLVRRDGLHSLFKDFFGFKIYSPDVANTIPPTVHLYDVPIEISGNQMIPWANKVNAVLENPRYRKELLAMANSYIAMGHKVLLVSDRVGFLKHIHENVKGRSALFIGEASFEDREVFQEQMTNNELDIFCASQNIFSEGISQNNLSCLILGSPIGNNESLLEQLAGRVMRQAEGKLDPVVIDIGLEGTIGKRHRRDRCSIYAKNGWVCEPMNLGKLINKNKKAFAKLLNFKV